MGIHEPDVIADDGHSVDQFVQSMRDFLARGDLPTSEALDRLTDDWTPPNFRSWATAAYPQFAETIAALTDEQVLGLPNAVTSPF